MRAMKAASQEARAGGTYAGHGGIARDMDPPAPLGRRLIEAGFQRSCHREALRGSPRAWRAGDGSRAMGNTGSVTSRTIVRTSTPCLSIRSNARMAGGSQTATFHARVARVCSLD